MLMYVKPAYLLGLDLGKKRDYTALAVLKQQAVPTGRMQRVAVRASIYDDTAWEAAPELAYQYDLVHLDRWRGRNYRDAIPIVDNVIPKVRHAAYEEHFRATGDGSVDGGEPVIALVVDQTGVGEAVIEDLRAAGLQCVGVTIHGGDASSPQPGGFRVPKRALVATVEVLLQNRRLRIASQLPLADVLVSELDNFKTKITLSTGHDTYGAGEEWREGAHDDTVLAVALAAWYGEEQDPVGQHQAWQAIVRAFQSEYTGGWA
jgi:hypothetical protein